jgi:hypothetical protein
MSRVRQNFNFNHGKTRQIHSRFTPCTPIRRGMLCIKERNYIEQEAFSHPNAPIVIFLDIISGGFWVSASPCKVMKQNSLSSTDSLLAVQQI